MKQCARCHSPIETGLRLCAACETPHHSDCWGEQRGCVAFGCQCPVFSPDKDPEDSKGPSNPTQDPLTHRFQVAYSRLKTLLEGTNHSMELDRVKGFYTLGLTLDLNPPFALNKLEDAVIEWKHYFQSKLDDACSCFLSFDSLKHHPEDIAEKILSYNPSNSLIPCAPRAGSKEYDMDLCILEASRALEVPSEPYDADPIKKGMVREIRKGRLTAGGLITLAGIVFTLPVSPTYLIAVSFSTIVGGGTGMLSHRGDQTSPQLEDIFKPYTAYTQFVLSQLLPKLSVIYPSSSQGIPQQDAAA